MNNHRATATVSNQTDANLTIKLINRQKKKRLPPGTRTYRLTSDNELVQFIHDRKSKKSNLVTITRDNYYIITACDDGICVESYPHPAGTSVPCPPGQQLPVRPMPMPMTPTKPGIVVTTKPIPTRKPSPTPTRRPSSTRKPSPTRRPSATSRPSATTRPLTPVTTARPATPGSIGNNLALSLLPLLNAVENRFPQVGNVLQGVQQNAQQSAQNVQQGVQQGAQNIRQQVSQTAQSVQTAQTQTGELGQVKINVLPSNIESFTMQITNMDDNSQATLTQNDRGNDDLLRITTQKGIRIDNMMATLKNGCGNVSRQNINVPSGKIVDVFGGGFSLWILKLGCSLNFIIR